LNFVEIVLNIVTNVDEKEADFFKIIMIFLLRKKIVGREKLVLKMVQFKVYKKFLKELVSIDQIAFNFSLHRRAVIVN